MTLRPPRFLPDDVDGRALFDIATRAVRGKDPSRQGVGSLGDIVAVPTVRDARHRGLLARSSPCSTVSLRRVSPGTTLQDRSMPM